MIRIVESPRGKPVEFEPQRLARPRRVVRQRPPPTSTSAVPNFPETGFVPDGRWLSERSRTRLLTSAGECGAREDFLRTSRVVQQLPPQLAHSAGCRAAVGDRVEWWSWSWRASPTS